MGGDEARPGRRARAQARGLFKGLTWHELPDHGRHHLKRAFIWLGAFFALTLLGIGLAQPSGCWSAGSDLVGGQRDYFVVTGIRLRDQLPRTAGRQHDRQKS